ncbi:MAG: hypothetical protein IK066_06225, partial [Kiritimatiellae bacterium]|nr:hypothetical protein [Kiritimatiellia bacterium]
WSHPLSEKVPKIFSNHWKTAEKFFQSLENGRNFPTIGKKFSNHWKKWRKFSNHWKLFFQSLENFGAGEGHFFLATRACEGHGEGFT